MDFYKYLNSKDLADYLRQIDYQLNTLECAWIVRNSENITLSEKLEAMNHILTMPDCRYTCSGYPDGISIHETIHQYFNHIDAIKAELIATDEDTIYTYSTLYDDSWVRYEAYFRDYESCMAAYYKEFLQSIDPSRLNRREIHGYEIRKHPLNEQAGTISAEYRGNELISIHKCDDGGSWERVWGDILNTCAVYFPTPFLPGDILYDPIYRRPMVLGELPTTDAGMFLVCYRVSDDEKSVKKYYCEMPYEYLEYYHGELKGADMALSVISDFIKARDCDVG